MLWNNVRRVGRVLGRATRRVLISVFGRKLPIPPEDVDDPYATHLPVLVGLARLFAVRRVLELGCGPYSTLTFLDRSAFPDLVALHSLENDRSWRRAVAKITREDPRAEIRAAKTPMSAAVEGMRLSNYDLILVDDSIEYPVRAETIRKVCENRGGSSLVVIHDFEAEIYREAARRLPNRFAFTALTPNTGLAWDTAVVEGQRLEELNGLIEEHRERVRPQDLAGWIRVVDERFANIQWP